MGTTRSKLLVIGISAGLLAAGCSSDSSSGPDTQDSGTEIGGTATAPSGAVARLEGRNTLLLALADILFVPAHAGITGLQPVTGADVELIRVDDLGNQVGDVLATGVTSATGDYTLTVPSGVDLSGDLVVRIAGMGGTQMRAQVVQEDVDINPVSEFVLAKFIEQDTDLDTLTTASVIKLTGQVDDFDLTAGADMQAMLDLLQAETGAYVEDQIGLIETAPGDAATLVGDYRGIEMGGGLHDDDQQYGVGTLTVDGGLFEFALSDRGNGDVDLAFSLEEDFESRQQFNGGNPSLFNNVYVDTDGVTDPARISAAGVLSMETEFEEDIDGDFGWRYPPGLILLQKARNDNLFVATASEAGVRYQTIDTNDDGTKDAVDPEAREGDEVFRSLIVVAQQPAAMSNADLSGSFGEVFFEVSLGAGGNYDISAGHGMLTFDGFGSFDAGESSFADLARTVPGQNPVYSESTDPAENDVPYNVSDNGRSVTVGTGPDQETLDTLFDSNFDFFSTQSSLVEDNGDPDDGLVNGIEVVTSYAVRLPDVQLDISDKVYRVFFLGTALGQTSTALAVERFDTLLSVNNDGLSATIVSEIADVEKVSPTAEVEAFADEPVTLEDVPITIAANGAATIVVDDAEGTMTLAGYFSHDGSLGLFDSRYADTGQDPDELGIVILVEIDGN